MAVRDAQDVESEASGRDEMTYMERAEKVACASQIAVMVLLSRANDDVEFWPLRPRIAPASELTSEAECLRRGLRTVGVVGIAGLQPHAAFKEPLDATVVSAIGAAFTEYVHALIGNNIAALVEPPKGDEVDWLQHLWSLPDNRPE